MWSCRNVMWCHGTAVFGSRSVRHFSLTNYSMECAHITGPQRIRAQSQVCEFNIVTTTISTDVCVVDPSKGPQSWTVFSFFLTSCIASAGDNHLHAFANVWPCTKSYWLWLSSDIFCSHDQDHEVHPCVFSRISKQLMNGLPGFYSLWWPLYYFCCTIIRLICVLCNTWVEKLITSQSASAILVFSANSQILAREPEFCVSLSTLLFLAHKLLHVL